MAIVVCRDCGQPVSGSARRCPQCGAYRWSSGRKLIAGIVLVFVAFFLLAIFRAVF